MRGAVHQQIFESQWQERLHSQTTEKSTSVGGPLTSWPGGHSGSRSGGIRGARQAEGQDKLLQPSKLHNPQVFFSASSQETFSRLCFGDHPRGPSATRAPAARRSHTHRHYARREARGGDSAESARTSLSKGGSPSTVGGIGDWQREQAGSEEPCCSNRQQPRPSPSPNEGSDGCCTLQREGSACSCSSQQPDDAGSFSIPAFANLDAKNHQAAPRRPPELRVGVFLASAGICKGCAGSGPIAAAECPSRRERGHQGGVNCEVRATQQRKSISNLAAWRLRSRASTFAATAAPASRQTRAAARSSGPPR